MRVLTPMFALNMVSDPPTGNVHTPAMSEAHNTLARVLAENSTTLLKNNGILPLKPSSFKYATTALFSGVLSCWLASL